MPSYHHNPIGVPTGLPERLFRTETRKHVRAAFARQHSDPHCPISAGSQPETGIVQWLMAKSPCGHPTLVLAQVKGRHLGFGRGQGVNS